MKKKLDFDAQYEAIRIEMAKLTSKGLQLPDLTEGYDDVEEHYGKALPVPFEEAFQILASTKRKYFRLKTQEVSLYDTNFELKDLAKLFSKFRTKSIIGCFPYTSARYPWPVNSSGAVIPPMLQLDLSMLGPIGISTFGDGLLQVFASNVGEHFRVIPGKDVQPGEMDSNYLLSQDMYQNVLQRFVTTHRVIKELYPSGTIVNQLMASTLRDCLRAFSNNLDRAVAAKFKMLISLFDTIVHDDWRRGSFMFGWGWNYIDQESFGDCFMQLEGPEFDFNHEVMNGCGCLRYAERGDLTLNWTSYY